MVLLGSSFPVSPDPAIEYISYTPTGNTNASNFGISGSGDATEPGKTKRCRAIRVATGGTLVVVREDETAVTITGVQAGETLPVVAIRINSSGTTASGFTIYF